MLSACALTHTAGQQSGRHCSSIYSMVTQQSAPDGASAGLEAANTGCFLPVAGCHAASQSRGQEKKTTVSLNKSPQGQLFGSESFGRAEAAAALTD